MLRSDSTKRQPLGKRVVRGARIGGWFESAFWNKNPPKVLTFPWNATPKTSTLNLKIHEGGHPEVLPGEETLPLLISA